MNAINSSTKHQEFCPLDTTLEILSGKWKSIIICRLMEKKMRFTELLRTMPSCTRRMLALQLNQLADSHIIFKKIYPDDVPIKTVYALTGLGETLVPIIKQMDTWGLNYLKSQGNSEGTAESVVSAH